MSSSVVIFAVVGAKALWLLYLWMLSAIAAAALSKSKGYGEKAGLGTGLLLSALGPIIWLVIPPKDEMAEWHTRKPWQRRHKPTESEMQDASHTSGTSAGLSDPGAGSRPGESRD